MRPLTIALAIGGAVVVVYLAYVSALLLIAYPAY